MSDRGSFRDVAIAISIIAVLLSCSFMPAFQDVSGDPSGQMSRISSDDLENPYAGTYTVTLDPNCGMDGNVSFQASSFTMDFGTSYDLSAHSLGSSARLYLDNEGQPTGPTSPHTTLRFVGWSLISGWVAVQNNGDYEHIGSYSSDVPSGSSRMYMGAQQTLSYFPEGNFYLTETLVKKLCLDQNNNIDHSLTLYAVWAVDYCFCKNSGHCALNNDIDRTDSVSGVVSDYVSTFGCVDYGSSWRTLKGEGSVSLATGSVCLPYLNIHCEGTGKVDNVSYGDGEDKCTWAPDYCLDGKGSDAKFNNIGTDSSGNDSSIHMTASVAMNNLTLISTEKDRGVSIYCQGFDLTIGEGVVADGYHYLTSQRYSDTGVEIDTPCNKIIGGAMTLQDKVGTYPEIRLRYDLKGGDAPTLNIFGGAWDRIIGINRGESVYVNKQVDTDITIGKGAVVGLLVGGAVEHIAYGDPQLDIFGNVFKVVGGSEGFQKLKYSDGVFFGNIEINVYDGHVRSIAGGSYGRGQSNLNHHSEYVAIHVYGGNVGYWPYAPGDLYGIEVGSEDTDAAIYGGSLVGTMSGLSTRSSRSTEYSWDATNIEISLYGGKISRDVHGAGAGTSRISNLVQLATGGDSIIVKTFNALDEQQKGKTSDEKISYVDGKFHLSVDNASSTTIPDTAPPRVDISSMVHFVRGSAKDLEKSTNYSKVVLEFGNRLFAYNKSAWYPINDFDLDFSLGYCKANIVINVGSKAKLCNSASIYGGGQGYEYTSSWDAIKKYGATVAKTEGTTIVNIYGDHSLDTTGPDQAVYGGGKGFSDTKYSEFAKTYGSTTVNIHGNVSCNVYGGGAYGKVIGSTEVKIREGEVNNDVYGGGVGTTDNVSVGSSYYLDYDCKPVTEKYLHIDGNVIKLYDGLTDTVIDPKYLTFSKVSNPTGGAWTNALTGIASAPFALVYYGGGDESLASVIDYFAGCEKFDYNSVMTKIGVVDKHNAEHPDDQITYVYVNRDSVMWIHDGRIKWNSESTDMAGNNIHTVYINYDGYSISKRTSNTGYPVDGDKKVTTYALMETAYSSGNRYITGEMHVTENTGTVFSGYKPDTTYNYTRDSYTDFNWDLYNYEIAGNKITLKDPHENTHIVLNNVSSVNWEPVAGETYTIDTNKAVRMPVLTKFGDLIDLTLNPVYKDTGVFERSITFVRDENGVTAIDGGLQSGESARIASSKVVIEEGSIEGNVYGGSAYGINTGTTSVEIISGTVEKSVFGGGLGVVDHHSVNGHSGTILMSGEVQGNIYGGAENGAVHSSTVSIEGGNVKGSVFGGGLGYVERPSVERSSSVSISDGIVDNDVYGGAENGTVYGSNVSIEGGNVKGSVFGGGLGAVEVSSVENDSSVLILDGRINGNLYGGAKNGIVLGSSVDVEGGIIDGSVFGGGLGYLEKSSVENTSSVLISNGQIDGNVYGGSENGIVLGSSVVTEGGNIDGSVFGGGLGSPGITSVTDKTEVTVDGSISISGYVYGGAEYGKIDNGTEVRILSGYVNKSVYAGGFGATGNTSVMGEKKILVNGGEIHDSVYGGSSLGTDGQYDNDVDLNVTDPSDSTIFLISGYVGGSVFGGGYQGYTAGTSNIYVGYTEDKTPYSGNTRPYLRIGLSIYGGGDVGDATTVTPYTSYLHLGDTNVYMDGSGCDISLDSSIFGSGNSCLTKGNRTIYVADMGSITIDGIHRAHTVTIKNSEITLLGRASMSDLNNNCSFYLIDDLILMDNTTLHINAQVEEIRSLSSMNSVGDGASYTVSSSPSNTIYLNNGTEFIVMYTTINNGETEYHYGPVMGYTRLAMNTLETFYGAYAFGSSTLSTGGFVVQKDGSYVPADIEDFGESRCWYIFGVAQKGSSVTLNYIPDGSVKDISATTLIQIPKLSNDTSIRYTGGFFIPSNVGHSTLVGHNTGLAPNEYAVHVGTYSEEEVDTLRFFENGSDVFVTPVIDGRSVVSEDKRNPSMIEVWVHGGNTNHTSYVGYAVMEFQECTAINYYDGTDVLTAYIMHSKIEVKVEIYTQGDTDSVTEDKIVVINTIDGHGEGDVILPRGLVKAQVYLDGIGSWGYDGARLGVSSAENADATTGWNGAVEVHNIDKDLSSRMLVDVTNGGYGATLRFYIDDYDSDDTVEYIFHFTVEVEVDGVTRTYGFNVTLMISDMPPVYITFCDDSVVLGSVWKYGFIYGSTISEGDCPPTNEHFVGWYTDPGFNNIYNFNSPLAYDTSLYAKYALRVTLDHQNGNYSYLYIDKAGACLSKPADPSRPGYVFKEWYSIENGKEVVWSFT